MQVKNTIILLQFRKIPSPNAKQKDTIKLFIKLNPSPYPFLKLPELELYDEEDFKENTRKYIWTTHKKDKYHFIKGKFYDDFISKFDERIIQCSNICILDEESSLYGEWYEVSFLNDGIILDNSIQQIHISYKKNKSSNIITSANVLLDNNHSIILIDALLYLKNIFYYSDIVFDFLNPQFTISDITAILNTFSWKPINNSTIKRRFNNVIQKIEPQTYPALFKKI